MQFYFFLKFKDYFCRFKMWLCTLQQQLNFYRFDDLKMRWKMSFSRHLLKDGKFMHHNKYAYKIISCLLFLSTKGDAFLHLTPIVLFTMCPLYIVTIRLASITIYLCLKIINYFLLQYTLKYFLCNNHHDKNSIKFLTVAASY